MKRPEVIFITGASGFVGANLARKLLSLGHEVHVLLRNPKAWRLEGITQSLIVHKGSLLDMSFLKKTLKQVKPSYIFHLAAHGAYPFQTDDQQMITTNIVGLSNLLHASKEIQYKGFVNTGSSSEYGNLAQPMKETDALFPDSFYAATKSAATYYSHVFAKIYEKPIVTFRLFSVYGPFEEPTRLIPTAIMTAINKKTLHLTPGNVQRDFVYVEDVVNAYLHTMKRKIIPGDTYNIGTGKETSNDTVARVITSLSNSQLRVEKGSYPKRGWDKAHWCADITHTKKVLNWTPSYSIKEGLAQTYQWFVDNKSTYSQIYEKI